MTTQFMHRLLLIAPAAQAPNVAAWLNANLGPSFCAPTLGPPLNASGLSTDAPTHHWLSMALTDPQALTLLKHLITLAGIAVPAWSTLTRAEKIAWLDGVRSTIRTALGIWVDLSPNDGAWDDPGGSLTMMGVKRVSVALAGSVAV